MSSIKNIIFDLGNVIIDIDIKKTEAAFRKLNKNTAEFEAAYKRNQKDQIFERFEVGAITEAEFIKIMQAGSSLQINDQQIIDAWNALLLTIPTKRFQLLEQLSQQYNIFLLSNTNETHLRWVYNYLKEAHQIHDFDQRFFTKAYYSHLIQHRKPHTETYQYVLNDAGILGSETLFIDDLKENIEGAKQAGIHTILHNPKDDITSVVNTFLQTYDS